MMPYFCFSAPLFSEESGAEKQKDDGFEKALVSINMPPLRGFGAVATTYRAQMREKRTALTRKRSHHFDEGARISRSVWSASELAAAFSGGNIAAAFMCL